MKPLLLFALLSIQAISFGQLTFEELTGPNDFNISVIRKSPIGEFFIQAANDNESIYTSLDGQTWTKTALPVSSRLFDIQYFSDGTPVLKPEYGVHLVRRDGVWHKMSMDGGWREVEASFIKADTLFVFQDQSFGYSLDKGKTFVTMFTFGENIVDHSAHLFKFNHHFILHHTAGASDNLSIFTNEGERIVNKSLDLSIASFTYHPCGQVLICDDDRYYLIKEDEVIVREGSTQTIIPNFNYSTEFFVEGDHYFFRTENRIYKSTGCDFTWNIIASSDVIDEKDNIWVSPDSDIYLNDNASDFYIVQPAGSGQWEEHRPDINYPFLHTINESQKGHHALLTSSALFHKNTVDPDWIEMDSSGGANYVIQYSPNGGLYLNRDSEIQYSIDNGVSFTTIPLPESELPFFAYGLQVLDDNILVVFGGLYDECFVTVNNGQDWKRFVTPYFFDHPLIKLVDNYLLMAEFYYDARVTKINLVSGATETQSLGDFQALDVYGGTIMDDGTIYFVVEDIFSGTQTGLYRFRFDEGSTFVGLHDELTYSYVLISSGTDVIGIGSGQYHIFNGEEIETYPIIGLPQDGTRKYIVASNKHLYVIVDQTKVFRSTKPLSYPQFISGSVHHTSDQDCITDTLDPGLKYWQVKVEGDDYLRITTTNSEGQFKFSVPEGNFTISSQPLNAHWDLCDAAYQVAVNESSPNIDQDFQAIVLSSCADLEVDFSTPLLRRCFDNYYSFRVRNTGPQSTLGTTLTVKLDPFFEFTSATIPYTLVGDSILVFNLGVMAVNDEINFYIFFKLSCDAELGMEHCLTGTLQDDNECGESRSTYTECQENIGSYDPNDKRTFNELGEEAETVDKGEYIYYHIRFQNTGTDTAFNIRVIDPLSPKLDLSTLEMLSASQTYTHFISDGPALVVLFDDILLPDSSTNEPASHGFFKFRVKPLPEYDYETNIPNQARIYFDFNDPILTNEANMIIRQPVGTKDVKDLMAFDVYPNPTNSLLTLTMAESDFDRISEYEIIDHLGRTITQSSLLNRKAIDVSHLAQGVYNLLLRENQVIVGMRKFVRL